MIVGVVLLTALLEVFTIFSRLVFGTEKDKLKKNKIFKFHLHHSYLGIAFILFANYFLYNEFILIVGWAMLLSDAIHHFIVLPILVGRTEFP